MKLPAIGDHLTNQSIIPTLNMKGSSEEYSLPLSNSANKF
jgi:hypothetical protein